MYVCTSTNSYITVSQSKHVVQSMHTDIHTLAHTTNSHTHTYKTHAQHTYIHTYLLGVLSTRRLHRFHKKRIIQLPAICLPAICLPAIYLPACIGDRTHVAAKQGGAARYCFITTGFDATKRVALMVADTIFQALCNVCDDAHRQA